MNKGEVKRKIEIHLETTNECIDNCNINNTTKSLLEQDNDLFKEILEFLENEAR